MIKMVGQGTFGEVWKAKAKESGEVVALKKVLMKNEQEGFPITALREIKILKMMRHTNVLAVKEIVHSSPCAGEEAGSVFLVFEFMDHDLGGLLNRGVKFTPAEIMCLTKQILEGMHYIHTNKVLHRDMKVANLLLNNQGVLKVADFGLARGYDKNNSRYTRTVCTRWYRPPEILLGEQNYTMAIDIWGVGCVIGELFEGRPILQGGKRGSEEESEHDLDQYTKICKLCGTPNLQNWPGHDKLPMGNFVVPKTTYRNAIRSRFQQKVKGASSAIELLEALLALDPSVRAPVGAATRPARRLYARLAPHRFALPRHSRSCGCG